MNDNTSSMPGYYYKGADSASPDQTSICTHTYLGGRHGCVPSTFLLCYWDNILGPRIRHVWLWDKSEFLDTDVQKTEIFRYIANHTLSGQICRRPNDPNVDSKFYVLKDQGIAVTAFIFSALGEGGDFGVHSFSVIVNYKELPLYLNWQNLTQTWMTRGVAKLRIALERTQDSASLQAFSTFLTKYVEMIQCLRESGLPQRIPLTDTAFYPEHNFDPLFIHRAVLSHLITCGRSIVTGKSAPRINLAIGTLAMFLQPHERSCSYYVSTESPQEYNPDVFVQGLLLNNETEEGSGKDVGHSLKNIYHSHFPTTLVDLESHEVRLSGLPHEHCRSQHMALLRELNQQWTGRSSISYPTKDMFRTFEDADTLVSNFFEEMTLLPSSGGYKEAYVNSFLQHLDKKALVFIKQVESVTQFGRLPIQDGGKQVREDVGLTVTGDFLVVLAAAEKLKPGISNVVCMERNQQTGDDAYPDMLE